MEDNKNINSRELKRIIRRDLRHNMTPSEARMWKALKSKNIEGVVFRRQFSVGPYVLDFYCPQLKLCIEVDGGVHDSYEAYRKDCLRTKYLNRLGIEVVRYKNRELLVGLDQIVAELKSIVRGRMDEMGL